MKETILQTLSQLIQSSPEETSSRGLILLLILWGLLLFFAGLIGGFFFSRKPRLSVVELENDNYKNSERLDLYRSTVERQFRSAIRYRS